MVERTTKLKVEADYELSMVAEKKQAPVGLTMSAGKAVQPTATRAPTSKDREIVAIEREKRKSSLQQVGQKKVMRIFLDNNGVGFKTLVVPHQCDMRSIVEMMKKKVFTDCSGFGVWEVRDKSDVRLLDPDEDVSEVMDSWKQDVQYKFVFKKALGENAKLYYNLEEGGSSSVPVKRSAPSPNIKGISSLTHSGPQMVLSNKDLTAALTKRESSPALGGAPNKPKLDSSGDSIKPSSGLSSSPTEQPQSPGSAKRRAPPSLDESVTQQPGSPPNRGGSVRRPPPRVTPSPTRTAPTRGLQHRPPPARGRGATVHRPPPSLKSVLATPEPAPVAEEPEPVIAEPVVQPMIELTDSFESSTPEPVNNSPPREESTTPEPSGSNADSSDRSYKTKPIREWSIEEVGDWISDLGFEKMRGCFIDNYISGMELVDLENGELKDDLGVTALGARKAILREIELLK